MHLSSSLIYILLTLPVISFSISGFAQNGAPKTPHSSKDLASAGLIMVTPLSVPDKSLRISRNAFNEGIQTSFTQHHGLSTQFITQQQYSDLWTLAVKEQGGLYSPYTGKMNRTKQQKALKSLIEKLTGNMPATKVSYVVFPSLETRQVKVRESLASWDGVRKRVKIQGQQISAGDADLQLAMNIQALSLRLDFYTDNAEWEGTTYGGIHVLHRLRLRRGELRVEDNKRLYNAKNIEKAAEIALNKFQSHLGKPSAK